MGANRQLLKSTCKPLETINRMTFGNWTQDAKIVVVSSKWFGNYQTNGIVCKMASLIFRIPDVPRDKSRTFRQTSFRAIVQSNPYCFTFQTPQASSKILKPESAKTNSWPKRVFRQHGTSQISPASSIEWETDFLFSSVYEFYIQR